MHRTGHWLGLDVHDAGDYKRAGEWRTLACGMVLTVEPGLYIRAADDVPQALRNIGVRIEDDVHVTESGYEVLTAEATSVDDIEALMRDARARLTSSFAARVRSAASPPSRSRRTTTRASSRTNQEPRNFVRLFFPMRAG